MLWPTFWVGINEFINIFNILRNVIKSLLPYLIGKFSLSFFLSNLMSLFHHHHINFNIFSMLAWVGWFHMRQFQASVVHTHIDRPKKIYIDSYVLVYF